MEGRRDEPLRLGVARRARRLELRCNKKHVWLKWTPEQIPNTASKSQCTKTRCGEICDKTNNLKLFPRGKAKICWSIAPQTCKSDNLYSVDGDRVIKLFVACRMRKHLKQRQRCNMLTPTRNCLLLRYTVFGAVNAQSDKTRHCSLNHAVLDFLPWVFGHAFTCCTCGQGGHHSESRTGTRSTVGVDGLHVERVQFPFRPTGHLSA